MSFQPVNDSTRWLNLNPALRLSTGRALASAALSLALAAFPVFPIEAQADEDVGTAETATAETAESASQDGAEADTATSAQGYAFSGAYRGVLAADGDTADMNGEDIAAAEQGQNAMLAQHGGWATARNGSLSKDGEGASGEDSDLYGANSVALAANAGSVATLAESTVRSQAQGANALFATDAASVWANSLSATTAAGSSRGLVATFDGAVIANDLDVQTTGSQSTAIDAVGERTRISATNSLLSVADDSSPILHSSGAVEVENILARTSSAQLASVEEAGSVLLSRATLSSTTTASANSSGDKACGIVMYHPESRDATTAKDEGTARFQAADSTLSSSIKDGSLFYLTNTQAKVVLSDTSLEFDSSSAKLMRVVGDDANGWGKSGENGATATFTGLNQKLNGDIEVDSISTLDCYLLENTDWTGASTVSVKSGDAVRTENLTVNIDASSSWTVTANSTVTNLNLASGGKLVDEKGNSVKIVDADGLTLVDGASSISITVTGDFSTSMKTSSVNELDGPSVDRSEFDAYFNLETAFGTNGAEGTMSSEEQALEAASYIRNWFYSL